MNKQSNLHNPRNHQCKNAGATKNFTAISDRIYFFMFITSPLSKPNNLFRMYSIHVKNNLLTWEMR